MSKITFGFGSLLVIIGLSSFVLTRANSVTALIPAFAGFPLVLAGFAIKKLEWRVYGIYAAMALSILLVAGSIRGSIGFFNALAGGKAITLAEVLQIIMVILASLYLILSFRFLRPSVNKSI